MSLTTINKQLSLAKTSFDVFGVLSDGLDSVFRRMAKVCHEDLFKTADDKKTAHETFIALHKWYEVAKTELVNGTYSKTPQAKLKTKKNAYVVGDKIRADIFTYYNCVSEKNPAVNLILKVCNTKADNDLLNNEIRVLKKLYLDTEHISIINNHAPKLLETFEIEGKSAAVFESLDQFYSLEQVRQKYPNGIDPKAMAWMFNRMLGILGILHVNGLVFCNLTPNNFYIRPDDHNGKLWDFSNCVEIGQKAKYINPHYPSYYPPEFKTRVNFGTDIYMAALNVNYLLWDQEADKRINNFLKYCMIQNPSARPQFGLDVFEEWRDTLKTIYGKPKFCVFEM